MRGGMRNPMPEQPADIRNKNFEEVALGYDMATAIDEAQRCLNCPNRAALKVVRLMQKYQLLFKLLLKVN